MNLLMHAPLYDDLGRIRYFLGAQIDVSSAVDVSPELESLKRSIMRMQSQTRGNTSTRQQEGKTSEFQHLIETLDMQELKAVRSWEGRMLQQHPEDEEDSSRIKPRRPGVLVREYSIDPLRDGGPNGQEKGTLDSLYNNVGYDFLPEFSSLILPVSACTALSFATCFVCISISEHTQNPTSPNHGKDWRKCSN